MRKATALILLSLIALPAFAQRGARGAGAPAADTAPGPPPEPAPRWPDGRVNLGSTHDKKGYWEVRPGLGGAPRAADVPMQPWTRALYQYRQQRTDLYPPLVGCKPGAGPSFFNAPGFEIVDVPELKSIFILNIAGPHSWRVIYMDGRPHPTGDDLRPTFLGHSVGHWEGDTLVVDTVGFNERVWIDNLGMPTTEQLHMIERFTRTDFSTIKYEVMVEDPGAYTAPFTGSMNLVWEAGTELFEYVCQQANYAHELMVGEHEKVDRTTPIVP